MIHIPIRTALKDYSGTSGFGGYGGQTLIVLVPSPISPFSALTVDIDNNNGNPWMDNGESTSELIEHLSAHKPVLVQSPNEILVSPTLTAYSDPPPTYHHATEEAPAAASLSGESTEEENIPHLPKNSKNKKWPRNETTTSIISTTTTTTTTTSRTTSTSTTRPNIPSRISSLSLASMTSRKRSRSTESLMSTTSKSSDPYLDALLARSIAALELSNSLLQSTLVTKSTLSSVLASDEALEKRERAFEERLLRSANPYYTPTTEFGGDGVLDSAGGRLAIEEREGKKMEWMREMESIVRDVEALFDTNTGDAQGTLQRPQRRASADPHHRHGQGEGGLVLGDHSSRTRSPPPRALTQFVSISGANAAGKSGFATEETADKDSIYLPSTTGLRRGPHKEPLSDGGKQTRRREGSTASASSFASAGRQDRGMGRGHSPIPSSSSNSGVARYLTASNSVTHPATHPEALPLSPQELLELHSESTQTSPATVVGFSGGDTNDRHAYLRRFGAHSGTPSVSSDGLGGSANSTLSRTRAMSSRPALSPHQPAPRYDRDITAGKGKGKAIATPHTAMPSNLITSFPSMSQQNLHTDSDIYHQTQSQSRSDHTRTESTATSHSATSFSTTRSSRSSARSSLSLGNLSFSLPLPSSITSALRRSPSLRGIGSPTSTNTDGSDVGETAYSPALEAIEDFEGEEGDTFGDDDSRGRNWNSTIQSPTRGRAILRGRFRTADTLRRILDTSPSPRPALSIPPRLTATSPRHISESQRIDRINTRSNTDSSNKTVTSRRTMRDSFASAESLTLAIPQDYTLENNPKMMGMHSASDIHMPSSSILSSRSYTSAHSPSTVSSTSDLHSSDMDGGRRRPFDGRETKRRLSLRPAPRFMPRTPGGRTAQLEVSGATARAPMMHAHLVELENPLPVRKEECERQAVEEAAIGDLSPLPPVGERLYPSSVSPYDTNEAHPSPAILSPPKPSTPPELPSLDQSQEERRRAQSLSASVSSIINQARALEHMKLASTGKVKGGSSLKGSPAWKAQHKLHGSVESTIGTLGLPNLTSNASSDAAGSGPSSKRTSWIGNGLMGLGLAITASSSTNVSTGAMTPPMRVSFAKEPVRYSEERESGTFDEDEEVDEEDGGEAGIDVQGLDAKADPGLTIKPRSMRRTKSWNGSVKGVSSRRVPSKKRSKGGESGKEKKEGWLEWFLTATTANGVGGVPGHMGASSSSMGIAREEMFESRGRDDW